MPKAKKKIKKSELFPLAVCFFFLVSFIAGFSHGCSVSKSRNYLEPFIINNIRIKVDDEGYLLQYQCQDAPYRYYIDKDRIESDVQRIEEVKSSSTMAPLFEDGYITKAFIGGVAAWGVKDIFTYVAEAKTNMSTSKRIAEVAVIVVAVAVGYGAGYWLAMKFNGNPNCDSQSIKDLLNDKSEWKRLNRFAWEMALDNASYRMTEYSGYRVSDVEKQKNQESLLNQILLRLDRLRKRSSDINRQFITSDYKELEEVVGMKNMYLKTYEEFKVQSNQSAFDSADK